MDRPAMRLKKNIGELVVEFRPSAWRMETVAIKKVLQDRRYKNRVCHRDVKPQNVLVDPLTHQVKIRDFGNAKVLIYLTHVEEPDSEHCQGKAQSLLVKLD
ncbi:hypothetical protein ZWY2020_059617 [Hordeum vulgare]|nr:hypothetical protein ZWY2020_059617 [Hordeum vulgare]